MTQNSIPSQDPANDNTLLGTLQTALTKYMQGVDDMLPATVIAYDRATNVATLQPQIMMVSTYGEKVARPHYASCPVFSYGGGGFCINFDIKAGDSGWIKANDRDISLYVQAAAEAHPNTKRTHSFRDAMFFPDVMKKYTLTDASSGMTIQNLAGTTKLEMFESKIKMTVGACTGVFDSSGLVITNGDIIADGKSLKHHVHSGVQSGASNTGQPV